jgi:hypothetical protein
MLSPGAGSTCVVSTRRSSHCCASPSTNSTQTSKAVASIFLPSPLTRFIVDFDAADRDFCDAEVRAVWLAIINMDSVATVTRWSPEEWTSLGEWAIWRRRLIEADVPVTPMSFGAVATEDASAERWLPFSSATTHSIPGKLARGSLAPAIARCGVGASAIWCCGEIVAGPDLEPVRRAAAVVAEHRIGLAAITLDDQHRVLACTSRPEIRIPAHAHRIGARIAERLHDDVSHR